MPSKGNLYLVFAENITLSDAVEKRICDLPGCASNQNSNGVGL